MNRDLPVIYAVRTKVLNRDTENSQKDMKFGMYLPCVAFHKFDVAILKILLFGHFMANNPKWPPLFGHKMAKKQHFY